MTPVAIEDITPNILSLVYPKTPVGKQIARFGRDFDGGYVMINDFTENDFLISFGVADDISFERQLMQTVGYAHLYDNSIPGLPTKLNNSEFFKETISRVDKEGFCNLRKSISRAPAGKDLILKSDVEGGEWDLLEAATSAELQKFRQIVIEFHGFGYAHREEAYDRFIRTFEKINKTHQSINVHGNNFSSYAFGEGSIPQVLEISYARKSDYDFKKFDKALADIFNKKNALGKEELVFLKDEYGDM